MVDKSFAWKVVTDSALTVEVGSHSKGDKKENLYALMRADMSEIMRIVGVIASMSSDGS